MTQQNYAEMIFKKRVFLTILTKLQNDDFDTFIKLWNEYVDEIYEGDRRIFHNDEYGVEELLWDIPKYDIIKMVDSRYYDKDLSYITMKDGLIRTFDKTHMYVYTDVNALVSYIVDNNSSSGCYIDIDEYVGKEYINENRDMIIREFVALAPAELDFNMVHNYFVLNNIETPNDILDMDVWDVIGNIQNPIPNFLTKQEVWDEMRKVLKGRETCEGWKDTLVFDLECRIKLICWGKEVDTNLIEIALRKNRYEQDVITLTSVWYDEDGKEMREYDNIMDLNFQEMCKVYEMMLKNL
jgi:SAM-dependent methyltransferase